MFMLAVYTPKPCDSGLSDFTLYELEFATGLRRLHGPELRAISFFRCGERDGLWVATMNALHTYVGGTLRFPRPPEQWLIRNLNS